MEENNMNVENNVSADSGKVKIPAKHKNPKAADLAFHICNGIFMFLGV